MASCLFVIAVSSWFPRAPSSGLSYTEGLSISLLDGGVKPSFLSCEARALDDRGDGDSLSPVQKRTNKPRVSESARPLSRDDFIAWGKAGARARMRKLTAEERRAVARTAARARWTKRRRAR